MDSKVCLINSFWLGDRRYEIPEYKEDKLYFVKKQIEVLQTQKHNLTKIIFNFNIIPEHYHYLAEVFSITPKQIQGAEVEINIRENVGISYGAWSDLFIKYKSEYDYYVFNEDDYFFVQDNWDGYLVNKHNSYDDCGYLCMLIREPHIWNDYRKHAGSSIGIASSETLMKIYSKYGKLPSISSTTNNPDEYDISADIQIQFGFAFLEIGLNLYDIRDDYSILFQKGSPVDHNCFQWKLCFWNSESLSVCNAHFLDDFSYYMSYDLEFLEHHQISTYEEAMYYYNNKLTYFKDKYEGDDTRIEWVKRELPA